MRRRMVIEKAERLHRMPPYPVAELARYKQRLIARGITPIDLTIGRVEGPRQESVVDGLTAGLDELSRRPYDAPGASPVFCEAFSRWLARRFDIDLDPATQILPLVNTKIGASCLPLALVNPGEIVFVPDPAYPAYRTGTIMAGGRIHPLPLLERNDYLPNLLQVDPAVAHQARLMFFSYPNNPTGAVADLNFFRDVVEFARKNNVIVCHDATHAFLTYDDYEAPSFLQAPGGADVGIELFSLSVLMGGQPWDLGVAVGNPSILEALAQLTQHLDTPVFRAVQQAGVAALEHAESQIAAAAARYARRRDTLVDGLHNIGWKIRKPKGSLYAWITAPPRYSSARFSVVLRKSGIFAVPGSYMGEFGEGYVRMSLNAPEEDLQAVVDRMEQSLSRLRRRRLTPMQYSLV